MSVLKSSDKNLNIYTEFLDAQRISKEESWPAFEKYLKAKYNGIKFDLILASDDDALDFLIPRYKEMFPDTPFVFCGINNLDENKFKQHQAFIGISQEIDAGGTIELALRLMPLTEKFLVISDRTSAGIKTTLKFKKDLEKMGPLKQQFHLIDDFTLDELKEHLVSLGANDLVLVLRIQKIKGIDKREPVRFLKFISDTSPVPAFRVWGKGDSGFVGGVLVSAVAQGKAAGRIGLKILEEEQVKDIPQVHRSPNIPILNYEILKKFNISEKNIPQGTKITNRPVSLLEKYRRHIQFLIISFILLILIIISLSTIIFYRRKNEKLVLQSKNRLFESEKKFRYILDSLPDMILEIDPKLNILWANQTALSLNPEAIGQKCHKAFYGKIKLCDGCYCVKTFKTGQIESGIMYQPASETIEESYWENFGVPLQDDQGNVSSVLEISRNITDRELLKKREFELQRQLFQAQKMESIGTLAGGIAHDFNNILAAIIGFTQLSLEAAEKDTPIEENLQEVFSAGIRAKNLVNQILTFARKTDEEIEPLQPYIILKEVSKFIRSSIPTTIEIRQNIKSDSFIIGNPIQIHQVLMNLCTNSAQAMEDKGGLLELDIRDIHIQSGQTLPEKGLKEGKYIQIKVSDTGTGVPPEILDSIFEPYFTTKDPGEGTGLGLSVVQGIVASHGGKITADSVRGKGMTFTIHLPISKGIKSGHPDKPEELQGGSERILFIDDEEAVVKVGKKMLELLGYTVDTKTDIAEALSLFKSKTDEFDLVITDMTMPNMTGDKLAIEIKNIKPDIPIILCTGYSKMIKDKPLAEYGIKALIYKPIEIAELAGKVRRVLDSNKDDACKKS